MIDSKEKKMKKKMITVMAVLLVVIWIATGVVALKMSFDLLGFKSMVKGSYWLLAEGVRNGTVPKEALVQITALLCANVGALFSSYFLIRRI